MPAGPSERLLRLTQLIDPEDAELSHHAPLVDLLAPDFTHTSLEFIE